jgi:hypothetical protein
MSEHSDKPDEEAVEDLAVPETDADDVQGGALNAYLSKAQGEKQGAAIWDPKTQQSRQTTVVNDP